MPGGVKRCLCPFALVAFVAFVALAALATLAAPVHAQEATPDPTPGLDLTPTLEPGLSPVPIRTADTAASATPTPALLTPIPSFPDTDAQTTPQNLPVEAADFADAPSILSIEVYADAGLSQPAAAFNPRQDYWMKVTVSHPGGIGRLRELRIKWWFSATDDASESSFDAVQAVDNSAAQVFSWSSAGNAVVPQAGGSWAVQGIPPQVYLDDPEQTVQDFVFQLTIGKTARETIANQRWEIAARAIDQDGASSYAAAASRAMNWYGEIILPTVTVDWGMVAPGLAFTDPAARRPLGVDAVYISNGDYAMEVRADPVWFSQDGAHYVTLTDAITGADQFSLRAAAITVVDILRETVLLPAGGYATAILDHTGVATTEAGRVVSTHTLYLCLSPQITHSGPYAGTITYLITNR